MFDASVVNEMQEQLKKLSGEVDNYKKRIQELEGEEKLNDQLTSDIGMYADKLEETENILKQVQQENNTLQLELAKANGAREAAAEYQNMAEAAMNSMSAIDKAQGEGIIAGIE